MKLKEKLMREWIEDVYFGKGANENDAYLAGFDKAREMETDQFAYGSEMKKEMLAIGEEEVCEE